MSLFRKKPIVIEAVQFDGTPGGAVALFDVFDIPNAKFVPHHDLTQGHLTIQTLEGTMRADAGWWIIRGVNGEFYPCAPDIFNKSYEAIL